MSLDTLYGAGARAAIIDALAQAGTVSLAEFEEEDGSVSVQAAWGTYLCRMACFSDRVHFTYLSATCASNPDRRQDSGQIYASLCANLRPLLKSFGVAQVTAGQYDADSTAMLLDEPASGFAVDPESNMLVWPL